MAQEQSIEAARARIQRLVEEITALSKKEMRSEEYFQEFLTRAVQATDARGGAVWLVAQRANDGKSEFQLTAQVELESSLFHENEQQHSFLLRADGGNARRRKSRTVAPRPKSGVPIRRRSRHNSRRCKAPARLSWRRGTAPHIPFFTFPCFSLKEQVVGILAGVAAAVRDAPGKLPGIHHLPVVAVGAWWQHLHSRRFGTLVLENQRLQQVLKFSNDLAGSLDPLEVSRLAANYGRDLIGLRAVLDSYPSR